MLEVVEGAVLVGECVVMVVMICYGCVGGCCMVVRLVVVVLYYCAVGHVSFAVYCEAMTVPSEEEQQQG